MKTLIIYENISEAARLIRSDELVAVPTETVYGLAGNGLSDTAVGKIYEVKGRPPVKPLALMVAESSAMDEYCEDVPESAKKLADAFWPGPLTIILKSKPIVPPVVRAGGETVALRCPDHEKTLELIRLSGLPLAAPSANPSGEPSPKNAETVVKYFDGDISAVIDGGECNLGTESTIIDMSKTPYSIIRQGALPKKAIEDELKRGLTVIGLTGGSGCGKTTALDELRALGALCIDCDALYHEMLECDKELSDDIFSEFPGAFSEDGLDRKKLGVIVFNDTKKLEKLNEITHRHISKRIDGILREYALNGGKLCALDAVALIESGLKNNCDTVIGVCAEKESRIERICTRDGIDREYAKLRISAQKPDEYYCKNCDRVIYNNGTQEEYTEQCKKIIKEVLKNV